VLVGHDSSGWRTVFFVKTILSADVFFI